MMQKPDSLGKSSEMETTKERRKKKNQHLYKKEGYNQDIYYGECLQQSLEELSNLPSVARF